MLMDANQLLAVALDLLHRHNSCFRLLIQPSARKGLSSKPKGQTREWDAPKWQSHLVHQLQIGEKGDVLGPLHSAEEQPGRQLADVLNAHQVVSLHALGPVARRGVGLGAQQQRDEAGQVGLAVVRVGAVGQVLSRAGLGVRRASSLHS